MKFSVPPGSMEDIYKRLRAAEQEAIQYKAAYDELVDDLTARGRSVKKPIYLEKSLIDRLIVFCHPDKHNGSEIANTLTKELLKLRK